MIIKKTALNGILFALVFALSACGGGSGGGDGEGEGDDNGFQPFTESIPDDTLDADGAGEDEEPEDNGPAAPQLLGAGETVSGRLNEDEFITYRVPADSQVVLTSITGDSDLFLFDAPGFADEAFLCADVTFFREDICTGSGSGDTVFATVVARNSSDYTLNVTNDCSVGSVNQWVYRSMLDYYLFADQVPVVDPLDFESPSDLVREIRFNPIEPFSGIGDAVSRQVLFEEGREFGFGFQWQRDSAGDLRIRNIEFDSPFGRAGVNRGDIFHSLGGITDDELTSEQFFELIGTEEEPREVEWTFIDGVTGELESFVATQTEYSINTVAFTNTFTHPEFDGTTGYIVFNRFLNTSVDELDRAIDQLRAANITELVLDLRYNGGGRVFVAERLAAQLSGNRLTDEVLSRTRYNNTYQDLNSESFFEDALPALDLSRVIVLTSPDTASASELVINSLSAYMEVVTIGERSVGKPFQSFSRQFCGMALNAMNSQLVSATETTVAGGIGADCFAQDDLSRDYGIGEGGIEGMLLSALDFVVFGTCDAVPSDIVAVRNSPVGSVKEWDSTDIFGLSSTVESSKPWPFDAQ